MLVVAFFVLILAIGMKVVAKVSDSRVIFQLSVLGFIVIYVIAALAISWLKPDLPGANISSFSELVAPTPSADQVPSTPQEAQDVIIRQ